MNPALERRRYRIRTAWNQNFNKQRAGVGQNGNGRSNSVELEGLKTYFTLWLAETGKHFLLL